MAEKTIGIELQKGTIQTLEIKGSATNEGNLKQSATVKTKNIPEFPSDPKMVAKLATAREFNSRLEGWAEIKVEALQQSLMGILGSVPFNDGEMAEGLIQLCHQRIDSFAAEVAAYRAKTQEGEIPKS